MLAAQFAPHACSAIRSCLQRNSLPDEACWEHAEKEQNIHDGDG